MTSARRASAPQVAVNVAVGGVPGPVAVDELRNK
jgi:hypothetical protein